MYRQTRRSSKRLTDPSVRRQKRAKTRPLIVMIGVVVFAVTGWFGWQYVQAREPLVSRLPMANIESKLRQVAANYPDIIVAAAFMDIPSGEMASIQATQPFVAASTTKSIVACLYLSEVESGQRALNDHIDAKSARFYLEQLINQSNNDAWIALRDAVGREQEQRYAQRLGLVSYDMSSNTINASDLAILLQQIYQRKLLNEEHTDLLLSWMQHTYEERFIPASLPLEAKVYHKAGTLEDVVHDAAIVEYGGRSYAWVVMTSGRGKLEYERRQQLFRDLNQAVFSTL